MTELTAAPVLGFRQSSLSPDFFVTNLPFKFSIPLQSWVQIEDLRDLPSSPHRTLRVDLGVMLNQNNGTFNQTNQIAADIAHIANMNQKVEYTRVLDKVLLDIESLPSLQFWDYEQAKQVIELVKSEIRRLP